MFGTNKSEEREGWVVGALLSHTTQGRFLMEFAQWAKAFDGVCSLGLASAHQQKPSRLLPCLTTSVQSRVYIKIAQFNCIADLLRELDRPRSYHSGSKLGLYKNCTIQWVFPSSIE